jgi:hypothetical protein
VAGKAGFEQRRVARFVAVALVEMTEPPAARGGVFFLSLTINWLEKGIA